MRAMESLCNTALVGIGSNIGNRRRNCRRAVEALHAAARLQVCHVSSYYETEPWGVPDQRGFVNCAARLATSLSAAGVFSELQRLEKELGKKVVSVWGPRRIDIDLLFFNSDVITTDRLVVPHPLLHERRFVLAPLAEIEPEFVHPILGLTVRDLLENVSDIKKVAKISGSVY